MQQRLKTSQWLVTGYLLHNQALIPDIPTYFIYDEKYLNCVNVDNWKMTYGRLKMQKKKG